jgi:ankyrin repeat protein
MPMWQLNMLEPTRRLSALHMAAQHGRDHFVLELLDAGANPNGDSAPSPSQQACTPLWCAVSSGSLACVRALLSRGAIVDAGDALSSESPLMLAARSGNEELTLVLLRAGADPNWAAGNGKGPLQAALESRSARPLAVLLSWPSTVLSLKGVPRPPGVGAAGPRPAERRGSWSRAAPAATALTLSAAARAAELAAGVDEFRAQAEENERAVLLFAVREGTASAVKLLVKRTPSAVMQRFEPHGTLLQIAVEAGRLDVVETLVAAGADATSVYAVDGSMVPASVVLMRSAMNSRWQSEPWLRVASKSSAFAVAVDMEESWQDAQW